VITRATRRSGIAGISLLPGNAIIGSILLLMRPTIEDLQAIWLFTYSLSSLLDAKNFLGEVSDVAPALDKVTPESLRYRALVAAAISAYMRPFTTCFLPPNRKVKQPLGDVPIPQHLAQFHKDALDLRDTMIGHTDATPADGYTETPNHVLVRIYPDTFSLHSAMTGVMEPASKKGLIELCDYFVKHCGMNLSRLTKIYRSELMQHQPGQYELVISEPPADWLIPFRTKHGDDFRE